MRGKLEGNTLMQALYSLPMLITALLVGLKIGNVITWPWWLVAAPLWGTMLVIIIVTVVVIGYIARDPFFN